MNIDTVPLDMIKELNPPHERWCYLHVPNLMFKERIFSEFEACELWVVYDRTDKEFYANDLTWQIKRKHAALLVCRPLHTLIYCFYLITIKPFQDPAHSVIKGLKSAQKVMAALPKLESISFKIVSDYFFNELSIADFYDLRREYGKVQREMNGGKKYRQPYNLAPCMERIAKFEYFYLDDFRNEETPSIQYPEGRKKAPFIGMYNLIEHHFVQQFELKTTSN